MLDFERKIAFWIVAARPKAQLAVTLFGFVLATSPACGQQNVVHFAWDATEATKGATLDKRGQTVIIGGTTSGPSSQGGYAEWVGVAREPEVKDVRITISTNGSRPSTWGKGIHAARKGAAVRLYLNGVLVHTIVCDRRGAFGDYWPKDAPVGSPRYVIPVPARAKLFDGAELKLKVEADPFAVLDVHSITIESGARLFR